MKKDKSGFEGLILGYEAWEADMQERRKAEKKKNDELEEFRHKLFNSEELCLRILAIGKNRKKGQPVFIWTIDGDPSINIRKMVACFINLGVHVHFSICEQKIISIDAVRLCNGECSQAQGSLHDFKKKNPYRKVTDAANRYVSELEEKKAMAREVLHPPRYGGWPNRYRIA